MDNDETLQPNEGEDFVAPETGETQVNNEKEKVRKVSLKVIKGHKKAYVFKDKDREGNYWDEQVPSCDFTKLEGQIDGIDITLTLSEYENGKVNYLGEIDGKDLLNQEKAKALFDKYMPQPKINKEADEIANDLLS